MKRFFGIFLLGIFLMGNFSFVSAFLPEEVSGGGDGYFGDSHRDPDPVEDETTINPDTNTPDTTETQANMVQGIQMDEDCLLNGQCKFNIYKFLGIRQSISDNNSPELFVQDILLSATFFIGTVVTLGIIVSGLMFIFAGATGKDPTKAKSGLRNSFIGLLLVISSYSIIRIVQYISKGL